MIKIVIKFLIFAVTLIITSQPVIAMKQDGNFPALVNACAPEEKILLVIDMQYKFTGARETHLQNFIIDEIKKAIKNTWLIVFIEYENWGPTMASILAPTQSYERTARLIKSMDSGYKCLTSFLEDRGITTVNNIRVCGVNTGDCVYSTVKDLNFLSPNMKKITICADGCWASNSNTHEWGMRRLRELVNSSQSAKLAIESDYDDLFDLL